MAEQLSVKKSKKVKAAAAAEIVPVKIETGEALKVHNTTTTTVALLSPCIR